MNLKIYAPAKVNLILRVLGTRPDGYHDLFMVMEKLSLADEITLEDSNSQIELMLEGKNVDEGMVTQKNLAYRAAAVFKEATGEKRGVKMHLKKRIPVAAGLGGGSSDAAAVLKGLNQFWQKGCTKEELAAMGAKLGADVPFFCFDGPAIAQGIGERITELPSLPNLSFLLINPGFSVSTPWVYKEFDRLKLGLESKGLTPEDLDDNFRPFLKEFCGVTNSLHNDLEKVTIAEYPEIQKIKDFLLDQGAAGVLMAGSGPTVFGIFESAKVCEQALDRIPSPHWQAFATNNNR